MPWWNWNITFMLKHNLKNGRTSLFWKWLQKMNELFDLKRNIDFKITLIGIMEDICQLFLKTLIFWSKSLAFRSRTHVFWSKKLAFRHVTYILIEKLSFPNWKPKSEGLSFLIKRWKSHVFISCPVSIYYASW